MEIKVENNTLIIKVPLSTPVPSASGKTMVIASSRGNVKTNVLVDGKPLTVGFNAYISR